MRFSASMIKQALARPFRRADGTNKAVMARQLSQYNGVFLEVGGGADPLLSRLESVPPGQKIVIDLPEALVHCRALGYECIDQDASATEWRVATNSVDVVVSNQCLEHIANTDHFVKEAHRVLKHDGVFLVSVPNQGALAFLVLMLLTINPPMNYVSDEYYGLGNPFSNIRWKRREFAGHAHLRLFTTRAMNDLLKVHGFQVLRNHGGSWGVPLVGSVLARLFPYYVLYTTVLARKAAK